MKLELAGGIEESEKHWEIQLVELKKAVNNADFFETHWRRTLFMQNEHIAAVKTQIREIPDTISVRAIKEYDLTFAKMHNDLVQLCENRDPPTDIGEAMTCVRLAEQVASGSMLHRRLVVAKGIIIIEDSEKKWEIELVELEKGG